MNRTTARPRPRPVAICPGDGPSPLKAALAKAARQNPDPAIARWLRRLTGAGQGCARDWPSAPRTRGAAC